MALQTGQSAEERARVFVAQVQDFAEEKLARVWVAFEQEVANERAAHQASLEEERSTARREITKEQAKARRESDEERARLAEEWAQLRAEREAWEAEKAKWRKSGIGASDLVTLNFGGEKLQTVKRSLLLQVEGSFLEVLFSGRHEERLDTDAQGNVFFDYSPHVMGPLIEHLRAVRDVAPGEHPQTPSIPEEWQDQWQSMLRFFGLGDLLKYDTYISKDVRIFSGVQTNVKISELLGWTRFHCEPWAHPTTSADLKLPPGSGANALLVAAQKEGSDVLDVAAMGLFDAVTKETDSTEVAAYHNGAYWYRLPASSFGFAPVQEVSLASAYDLQDSDLRLSWCLDGSGGWRCGKLADFLAGPQKVVFWARVDPSAFGQ